MTDKIKKAIAVLEVNKLISSSQTEFCESVDLAIQALEKQIPKKPKGIDGDLCPNCGTYNSAIPFRRNTVSCDTVYCWHCGTAIECEVLR